MKNALKIGLLMGLLAFADCRQIKTNIPVSNKSLEERTENVMDSTIEKQAHILCGKGSQLIRDGKYNDAIKVLRKAISFNYPDSILTSLIYTNMGYAYSELGKNEAAILFYNNALVVDPKNWRAHNNLASEYLGQKKLDDAEGHAKEAIKYGKKMIAAHITLAEIQLAHGNYNDAYNALIEGEKNCRNISPEMRKIIDEMKDKIRKRT